MKVFSIIMSAVATICFIISVALADECRSDEFEVYTGIMILISLFFMAVGALSTIHAFKQK